jgi:hypothetical protein
MVKSLWAGTPHYWTGLPAVEGNDYIINRWARQTGKSLNLAHLVVAYKKENPGRSIAVIVPQEVQSKYLREKIQTALSEAGMINNLEHQGVWIQTLTKFSRDLLEGYRYSLVLFDEYGVHDPKVFSRVLEQWEDFISREGSPPSSPLRSMFARLTGRKVERPPQRTWVLWTSNTSRADTLEEMITSLDRRVLRSSRSIWSCLGQIPLTGDQVINLESIMGEISFRNEYTDY